MTHNEKESNGEGGDVQVRCSGVGQSPSGAAVGVKMFLKAEEVAD
jgi:hypothetical protein